TSQPNRHASPMRMTYAFAYGIRSTEQEVAGTRTGRCRRGVLGIFTAAVLHGWHAGARHLRVALSAAGGPRDVCHRGDGDGGGTDLAGTARPPTRPAPTDGTGLRVHGDPRRGVRDGDRG